MPALGNAATPVPSPAYHRMQARLGSALHIDALTLINTLHLLPLCRVAVRLAHHRCPLLCPSALGAHLERIVKNPFSSSRFCVPCSGFRIKIPTTG